MSLNRKAAHRYEIHAGFYDTDFNRDYGEYPYSSYIVHLATDDKAQAERIFNSIYNYSTFKLHDSITGLYLHNKLMWYDGRFHPEIDDHAIDLDWFIEDNKTGIGEFFPIAIYEQRFLTEV